MAEKRRILILSDRDWDHPQGGGTGTFLRGLIDQWILDGHEITLVCGGWDGSRPREFPRPGLQILRGGGRISVFPRAALRAAAGIGHDADVILEVCNGISFFTPLWPALRKPRVLLVFHVHQDHYVAELGFWGSIAAFFLERLPLASLYRDTPVVTISEDSRAALQKIGIADDRITVVHPGLDGHGLSSGRKTRTPTLLYLGRLKQYKRIELLFDLIAELPETTLHLAGAGGHESELRRYAKEIGVENRIVFHGFVDEGRKAMLLQTAWLAVTASSAEGWSFSVVEAAASGTPTAALAVGGLKESIVDGETGILADDYQSLVTKTRDLIADPHELGRLGNNARLRSQTFTWRATADGLMKVIAEAVNGARKQRP